MENKELIIDVKKTLHFDKFIDDNFNIYQLKILESGVENSINYHHLKNPSKLTVCFCGVKRLNDTSVKFNKIFNNKTYVIPAYINIKELGKIKVTSIIDCAFCKYRFLEELYIPKTINHINSYLFYKCEHIKTLKINNNVDNINFEKYALSSYGTLTNIIFNDLIYMRENDLWKIKCK